MTATAEQTAGQFNPTRFRRATLPVAHLSIRGGERFLVRGIQKFAGVCLVSAALGLWLVPMDEPTMTALLCKVMVTLVMGFVGAALWQAGAPVRKPEIEVDLVRREVRLVREGENGREVVSRSRFRDLGGVQVVGSAIAFWDTAGGLLAQISLKDASAMSSLRQALRDEGINA